MKSGLSIPWELLLLLSISSCLALISLWLVALTTSRLWHATKRTSSGSKPRPSTFSTWTSKWKTKGKSLNDSAAFVFALLCLVIAAGLMIPSARGVGTEYTRHWWYFPHVPEIMESNIYFVVHLDPKDPQFGTRSRYVFCEEDPVFQEGEMLKDVIYVERGTCKELLHYNIESDNGIVRHYPEGNPYDGFGR